MSASPRESPRQFDFVIVLVSVVLCFLAYSLAAWMGIGRGLLFPSRAELGTRLPAFAALSGRLASNAAPCGRPGPPVTQEARAGRGVQNVEIDVTDHFSPNTVLARRHIPLQLDLHRYSASRCSSLFRIPAFRVSRRLSHGEVTRVVIFPSRAGRYRFTCGLGMMSGWIVVR